MKRLWRHRVFIIILVFGLLVVSISTIVHKYFVSSLTKDSSHGFFFYYFTNNTGGIFATLMGLATILGIYIAILQIREQKSIITTYSQLMDNIIKLIKESNEIKIVSFFVLPGYWQVINPEKRKNFKKAIRNATDKIKFVCISEKENLSILVDVAKKGTPVLASKTKNEKKKEIIQLQRDCESIISGLNSHDNCRTKKWEDLPCYFFIVTEKRAIIVTPVGLPVIDKNLAEYIQKNYDKNNGVDYFINNDSHIDNLLENNNSVANEKQEPAKVNTLGFETTDSRIIDMLLHQFNMLFNPNENNIINAD